MPAKTGILLFDLLARIDAPQAWLFDPTVEAFADEAAPPVLAALHGREHAMLHFRHDGACRIGLFAQFEEVVRLLGLRRDQRGALPRGKRMVDPTFRAFPAADATPVLELGCDLQWQRGVVID